MLLPKYGIFCDDIFKRYEKIFIFGDLHNNHEALFSFLKYHDLVNLTNNPKSLIECRLKDNNSTLLVFLGDIIGKLNKHSDYSDCIDVFLFLILNINNGVFFVLGNHEVSFLCKKKDMHGISNHALMESYLMADENDKQRNFYEILESNFKSKHICKNDMCSRKNSMKDDKCMYCGWKNIHRLKLKEMFFMHLSEYTDRKYYNNENDYKNSNDDYKNIQLRKMIILFILVYGECIAYFLRHKIYFVHAGLNFNKPMKRQIFRELCNIRDVWYANDTIHNKGNRDTTILFGHYSELCYDDYNNYHPFIYTDDEKKNNFICLDTGCYVSNVLSVATIDLCTNPYLRRKQPVLVNSVYVDQFKFNYISIH